MPDLASWALGETFAEMSSPAPGDLLSWPFSIETTPLVLTEVASDNFDRPNGSLAGSNGWLATSDGSMTIVSHEASGVGAAIAGDYRTDAYTSDQYSQCVVGSVTNIPADFIGLTVRHNPATNAEYAALYFDSGGSPECDIYFRTAPGAYTLLASQPVAPLAAGAVLTFIAIGTQLVFRVNGSTVVSVPDSTIAGGVPGVTSFGTMTLDTWQGGDATMSALAAAVASDAFTRANGNVSTGQPNWSAITATFSGVPCADCVIVSDEVNQSDTEHHADSRLDTFSADHWSTIQMGSVPLAAASAGFVGVLARWNGSKGYLGCIFGAPISYRIYLIQAGAASTLLASAGTKVNPTGTPHTIVAKGTRISLRVGGVEVLAVTDANCVTGQPGMQVFPPCTADNWSGGNA